MKKTFFSKENEVSVFIAKWEKKKTCLRKNKMLRIHITFALSQTNPPVTLPITFTLNSHTGKEWASQYKIVFILLFYISNNNKGSETGLG